MEASQGHRGQAGGIHRFVAAADLGDLSHAGSAPSCQTSQWACSNSSPSRPSCRTSLWTYSYGSPPRAALPPRHPGQHRQTAAFLAQDPGVPVFQPALGPPTVPALQACQQWRRALATDAQTQSCGWKVMTLSACRTWRACSLTRTHGWSGCDLPGPGPELLARKLRSMPARPQLQRRRQCCKESSP